MVLAGISLAILFAKAFSVLLGGLAGMMLPIGWLQLLCGLTFIGFGVWTLEANRPKTATASLMA